MPGDDTSERLERLERRNTREIFLDSVAVRLGRVEKRVANLERLSYMGVGAVGLAVLAATIYSAFFK